MSKYEIQTQFLYGWENVWHFDGEIEYFDSFEAAYNSLNNFFDEMEQAFFNGEIEDQYDINDFRIIKLEGVMA